MIKGITVTLSERTQSGTDAFNRPTYTEKDTDVEDVLVYPASSEDIVSEKNLYGKHLKYYLCVPKGDTHVWTDQNVKFFGETWKVYGYAEEWIDANNPSIWNKRYKCERYSK
jgi:hypothetical protein